MRFEALELLRLWLFGRLILHDWIHGLHYRIVRMAHLHGNGERVRTCCRHLIGVLELLGGMHKRRVLRVVDRRKMTDWRQVHVGIVKLRRRLRGDRLGWLVRLFLLHCRNTFLILLLLVVGRSVYSFSFFIFLGLGLHFLLLDLLPFLLRTMADILVILFSDCLEHYLPT